MDGESLERTKSASDKNLSIYSTEIYGPPAGASQLICLPEKKLQLRGHRERAHTVATTLPLSELKLCDFTSEKQKLNLI